MPGPELDWPWQGPGMPGCWPSFRFQLASCLESLLLQCWQSPRWDLPQSREPWSWTWLALVSFLDLSLNLGSRLLPFSLVHSQGLRPGFLGLQGPLPSSSQALCSHQGPCGSVWLYSLTLCVPCELSLWPSRFLLNPWAGFPLPLLYPGHFEGVSHVTGRQHCGILGAEADRTRSLPEMARSLCSDYVTQLPCMVRGHSATAG